MFGATVIADQEWKVKPAPKWISLWSLEISFLPLHITLPVRTLLLLCFPSPFDEFFVPYLTRRFLSVSQLTSLSHLLSLSAPMNISDSCPITTWLPFRAKLFPLLVKQDYSFKLTDSLTDNCNSLLALLDSSLKPHCTRLFQFLVGISLFSFPETTVIYPYTTYSRNCFFANTETGLLTLHSTTQR